MSELALNSFQQSTISQTFKKLGYDLPEAGMMPSRPPSTMEILKTPSRATTVTDLVEGTQFVIDVPRYGHLAMAMVEFVYTHSGTNISDILLNFPVGLTLARNISLQTANRTLYDQPDLASLGRVQVSPPGKANWLTAMAEKMVASSFIPTHNSTASCVSYCNVDAPFFEDERNFYDAARNESIRVVVTLNSKVRAGFDSTISFTSIACNLYTWHVKYDSETEKMLVEKNRNPSIPLQMLGYSHFMETGTSFTSGTTASIIMNSDVPAVRTYVRVKDLTTSSHTGSAEGNIPIILFKVKINGQEYQQEIPRLIGNSWGMIKGQSGNMSVTAGTATVFGSYRITDEILCINWAHDVLHHNYSSGFLPLVALNRPEITVTIRTAPSSQTFALEYCHEYLLMYSIDASNGQTMVYTSS